MIAEGAVHIIRLDGQRTHGWQVRIYRKNEKYDSKLFSDGNYGGLEGAYKKARVYRRKALRGSPAKIRKRLKAAKDHGRAWGKGFHYIERERNNGWVEKTWSATYWVRKTGKQMHASFSTRKYGYERAKGMAKKFRDTGIILVAKFGIADR